MAWIFALAGVSAGLSFGQTATLSTGSQGSSRGVVLPSSGRINQPGTVSAGQSASGANGVSTVSSSLQVGGNFDGSVPAPSASNEPLTLSLEAALKLGLASNLGPITAGNGAISARVSRMQALSALLPTISANASETVTQVNLAAYGFQFNLPPGTNFSIPTVVGPYSYSQLQGALSQSIFNEVERRNWQASKESERAYLLASRDARELVVLAVGGTYLQTLASVARVESQRAQVANAKAIYDQATVRKAAGTNSKIDVMRSLVEWQTQQQRLSSLEADLRKQRISLARVIGVAQNRELILSDALRFRAAQVPEVDQAIQAAWKQRFDLQSAQAQVSAADRAVGAARAERLPSAELNGNYGVIGPNPANTHGVFAVTAAVNVPIWQGNRVKADILQAQTTLAQRQAELADTRARIEQEVRNALVELQTAVTQVQLAETNRSYAAETLTEARDRFAAGVATTVEVVQAQEQVASAEGDYVSSLFSFNLAQLSLGRAEGAGEASIATFMKENRP